MGVTANNDVISTTTDKQSNPSVETNIPAQTQNTPQVVKETKVAEPQGYYAGDFVDVGNFRYRINSYYTTPQIGQDIMGTFLGAKASGTYLVLSVTIENIAKESKTLLGNNIVVIDSEGRQFSHDMTAEIYLSNNQQFNFQQMQPGLPRTGKIVFDVPKNIRGYLEISSDDMFSGDKKDVSWNPRNQTS